MALLKAIHPDQLTVVDTVAQETLGELRFSLDGTKAYRYVLVETAALLQGEVCYQIGLAAGVLYEVHNDQSADIPLFAGVAVVSIADGSYGWIQVAGYNATIRSMNDIALKDALVGATTDGEVDGDITTGKEHLVGAMALGAATTFVDDNGSTLDCCPGYIHNSLYKP